MRFVIVTGMSGAGKSTALRALEDNGYFCVDNMPIQLIEPFLRMITASGAEAQIEKAAVSVDIRSGKSLNQLKPVLAIMRARRISFEILFLESSDRALIRRYKETRRNHPLSEGGRIEAGIRRERLQIRFLKQEADYIVDTSQMMARELKQEMERIFVEDQRFRNLVVTILSFGFKFGIPADADLVFDARFLPNPYYVDGLRELTGLDQPVRDYLMHFDVSGKFLEKLTDLIRFLLPHYIQEGKSQLVIAVGCTGGRHRSVLFAEELYQVLRKECDGCSVRVEHRDMEHDAVVKQYKRD